MNRHAQLLEAIQKDLSRHKFDAVVRQINQHIIFFPNWKEDWIILEGQWRRNRSARIRRTRRDDDLNIEENQWIESVLELIKLPPMRDRSLQKLERPLRIFLAATADMTAERQAVEDVLRSLEPGPDEMPSEKKLITNWDEHSAAGEEVTPQNADVFLLCLWWQHSPVSDETEQSHSSYGAFPEARYLEMALEQMQRSPGRPQILVYRCNRPFFRPGETDFEEKIKTFQQVDQLYARIERERLATPRIYEDIDEFTGRIQTDLFHAIRKAAAREGKDTEKTKTNTATPDADLSENEWRALRDSYLHWLVEQHAQLELRGIGGDGRLPKIALEKVYVALKGYRTGHYEIEQSALLHNAEMQELIRRYGQVITPIEFAELIRHAERRAVVNNPIIPSMMDIHRQDESEWQAKDGRNARLMTITLADAFRNERGLVILGDPGSGKTTLARWIVLKLARTLLAGEKQVWVPEFQVNPDLAAENEENISIGPARLPVLVRISEFADAYGRARNEGRTLAIEDFLGRHSWMGQAPGMDPRLLNQLFRNALEKGEAVVLLDGMDEITEDSRRIEMVQAIEDLIDKWVGDRNSGALPGARRKSFAGAPFRTGGNQIVITSRIAGYQRKHLRSEITHVTIKPMSETAVRHFCDAWCRAVQQQLKPDETPETNEQAARQMAGALKSEIFRPNRVGVRELATNPLMVTILALVYRKNKGRLPEQRSRLYELAMRILIEEWRISGLKPAEIKYVLAPLAAHIHENYATGLIEEGELREILQAELARYRMPDPERVAPNFVEIVDEFILKVKHDVGILAERSEELYGFLHLTFQEYLAAINLVRDTEKASDAILSRLDDPRWREPILLALGYIGAGSGWGPKMQTELLHSLLNADDPMHDIFPRSTLLLARALRERAEMPEEIVVEICRRLFRAEMQQQSLGYQIVIEQIQRGLHFVYESAKKQILEKICCYYLENASEDNGPALSVARVIRANGWFADSLEVRLALIAAIPYDGASADFPVLRSLRSFKEFRIAPGEFPMKGEEMNRLNEAIKDLKSRIESTGDADAVLKEQLQAAEEQYAALSAAYDEKREAFVRSVWPETAQLEDGRLTGLLPFRQAMEQQPELLEHINRNGAWQRLIGLLYGGLSDEGLGHIAQSYAEIAGVLQSKDPMRAAMIEHLRRRTYWLEAWDNSEDTIYDMAVYLDTTAVPWFWYIHKDEIRIKTTHILEDSPLTGLLLRGLRALGKPEDLLPDLENALTQDDPLLKAHTLLVALMISPNKFWGPFYKALKEDEACRTLLLGHLERRWADLKGVLQWAVDCNRYWRGIYDLTGNSDQISDVVERWLDLAWEVDKLPYVNIDRAPQETLAVHPYMMAEQWAFWCSSYTDLPKERLLEIIGDNSRELNSLEVFPALQRSVVRRFDWFVKWKVEPIPPNYETLPLEEKWTDLCTLYQGSDFWELAEAAVEALLFCHPHRDQAEPGGAFADDILACSLFRPAGEQAHIWKKLGLDPGRNSEVTVFRGLLFRSLKEKNELHKARRLYWLAQYITYYHPSGPALFEEALKAARRISDAYSRYRALERLLDIAPVQQFKKIFSRALRQCRRIKDPDNQARALARLSCFPADETTRKELLKLAQEQVLKTASERGRVNAYLLIAPLFQPAAARGTFKNQVLKAVSMLWERDRMNGLISLSILNAGLDGQDWTPFYIGAFCRDLLRYSDQPEVGRSLWIGLAGPDPVAAAWELIETASDTGRGFLLDQPVIDLIDQLCEKKQSARLHPLLPYLYTDNPRHRSFLRRILKGSDETLADHAALMLGEFGELSRDIIERLGRILMRGSDLSRFRTSVVLHGPMVFIGNPEAQYRTSRIGLDTLLALARLVNDLRDKHPGKYNILDWTWMNIIHDSAELFDELRSLIDKATPEAQPALLILKKINILTVSASRAFYGLFRAENVAIREAVYYSLLRMQTITNKETWYPPEAEIQYAAALEAVELESGKDFRAFPDRQQRILDVLKQCLEDPPENEASSSTSARVVKANEYITAQIMALPPGVPTYRIGSDARKALEIAALIAESHDQVELLFVWANDLVQRPVKNEIEQFLSATLLEMALACAEFVPATVINILAKYRMADPLAEAALNESWFIGRASAIQLFSYLGQLPRKFPLVLRRAFEDVAEVQDAVLRMFQKTRNIDEEFVSELLLLLHEQDATLVYSAASALSIIAGNEKTSKTNRNRIISELARFIKKPDALKGVYSLSKTGRSDMDMFTVQYMNRLDKAIYQDLIEITGID